MIIRILVFALVLMTPLTAMAEEVEAELSDNFVAVSVGFNGAKMMVFGTVKSSADVAIVVEGPATRAKLRGKKHEMGIWVNGDFVELSPVPGFYAVIASKPVSDMASLDTIDKYGLKLGSLKIPRDSVATVTESDYEAMKKIRVSQQLFQENPSGVKIISENLFRADFNLPSSVPIGTYLAHIYLLRNGLVVAARDVPFLVAQVGLEATIYNLAHSRPFGYALLALVLSLGLGGGAAFLFRRVA